MLSLRAGLAASKPRSFRSLAPLPTRGNQVQLPTRFYSTPPTRKGRLPPKPAAAQRAKPLPQPNPPPRHEVHEKTSAVSIPFNPPGGGGGPGAGGTSVFRFTNSAFFDAALTTVVGLGMVFVAGVAYLEWYKRRVLQKIESAFARGYDPALDLAVHAKPATKPEDQESEAEDESPWTQHLRRQEQDYIDRIIQGKERGHYFVLLGPKGSGKTTMILDAMQAVEAEGIAMCDSHPNLEIFRTRMGKALNYEFNEDSQTGLFQRRDPREGGAALDIERALNKLEKVALRSARRTGRPLVLVINNIHFFNNDEEGRNMLLQLQQRGEAWAAAGILTLVLSSDDFWPYNVLRQSASRMHVLSIYDLNRKEALHASARVRKNANRAQPEPKDFKEAVSIVGGRLSFISKISKSKDMLPFAKHLLAVEKAWLLSQIGLIEDCDDDVMDEQKWSSCSWLLLREFVNMRKEQERERDEALLAGQLEDSGAEVMELPLPVIPYWQCRQLMTRADLLEQLDRLNIIAIDVNHDVRPDSMLILQAARDVVEQEGFDKSLDGVRARIDEIESLHRTRELTFKDVDAGDRIRLTVDKGASKIIHA